MKLAVKNSLMLYNAHHLNNHLRIQIQYHKRSQPNAIIASLEAKSIFLNGSCKDGIDPLSFIPSFMWNMTTPFKVKEVDLKAKHIRGVFILLSRRKKFQANIKLIYTPMIKRSEFFCL